MVANRMRQTDYKSENQLHIVHITNNNPVKKNYRYVNLQKYTHKP